MGMPISQRRIQPIAPLSLLSFLYVFMVLLFDKKWMLLELREVQWSPCSLVPGLCSIILQSSAKGKNHYG